MKKWNHHNLHFRILFKMFEHLLLPTITAQPENTIHINHHNYLLLLAL